MDRPTNPDTEYNAGLARAKKGQLTQAMVHFHKALTTYQTTDPKSEAVADTLRNLASCYYKMKKYDKALALDRQALQLYYKIAGNHPTQKKADTWYALGQSYMRLKELDLAEKAFKKARLVVLSVNNIDPMVKRVDEQLLRINQARQHRSYCLPQ